MDWRCLWWTREIYASPILAMESYILSYIFLFRHRTAYLYPSLDIYAQRIHIGVAT
jgi:hypothetical protein